MQKPIEQHWPLGVFPGMAGRGGHNPLTMPKTCARHLPEKSRGFTLLEALIASMITMMVIAGTLSTLVYGLRAWRMEAVKNEVNIDLEHAMEGIRQDLRLSSVGIGLMAFYPAKAAQYKAISFPMSSVTTNGLLTRENSGKIKWTQTVIYHVQPGSPDQLRRTVFSPRKTNATPSELYTQLQNVVQGTNLCLTGESVKDRVIFNNLVTLGIRPPEMQFDGYAPAYCKARTVNWGSVVLSNGPHELKFTVEGKNTNSSGYCIGVDSFSLSPSASRREGEIYLPTYTHPVSPYYLHTLSGGSVIAQDMSIYGANWSGNSQLTYDGAAVSNSITFRVPNDLWCDANFDNPPGVLASNVSRKIDESFVSADPFISDIVISMDKGTNWLAEGCTESALASFSIPSTPPAVVNVIYGGTNPAAAITMNGEWVRVRFDAGSNGNLYISNAKISRQETGTNAALGTTASLSFGWWWGPKIKIPANTSVWSDWVSGYEINRENNYLVQFELQTDSEVFNNARAWVNNDVPFMSSVNGLETNLIVGVGALEVRYPSQGLYRSGIFDTHITSPSYKTLKWTHVENLAQEADIDIRVRSGNKPDLSDAIFWLESGYFQLCNGANSLAALSPQGRYVQYEVLFGCGGQHLISPILRDVTIAWDVPMGLVDLQVDFGMGTNYGIVGATVDGQAFIKGLEIEMEIFKDGPMGTVTAAGTMEIRPLNTNK